MNLKYKHKKGIFEMSLYFPLYFFVPSYYVYPNQIPIPVSESNDVFPMRQKIECHTEKSKEDKLREVIERAHADEKAGKKTHWTSEEDALLVELVEGEQLKWKQVSQHFANRKQNMCYSRYRRLSMQNGNRCWNQEDDRAVVALVAKYGKKWKIISDHIPKYRAKQIRERYLNYLRPHIDKSGFTVEEDLIICTSVLEHGNKWRLIEKILPHRPQGLIKNRFYTKLQALLQTI